MAINIKIPIVRIKGKGKTPKYLDRLLICFGVGVKPLEGQTICPFLFVKIQEHLLLKFVLPVIYGYGVIMPVQSMNQSLEWDQISKIRN